MTTSIRCLTAADIAAAMRLCAAAGWNQTAADWHNLLRLAPETCFVLECDGTLAATTTAVCYGPRLAWIGMVLTDPALRRRGFARSLLQHTIKVLIAAGMEWIKLDATDMGAPLYRQLGFDDEARVERWGAIARCETPARVSAWHDSCINLDQMGSGVDRSDLLTVLAPMGAACVPAEGYAMARPGALAAYFGPCVSHSPGAVDKLLAWFLERYAQQPVFWDVLPDNGEAVRLARAHRFEPVRRLVRMIRPGRPGAAPLARHDAQTFAIAGFEYG